MVASKASSTGTAVAQVMEEAATGTDVQRLLEEVDIPVIRRDFTSASGLRYQLVAGERGDDSLTVHGSDGRLVLSVMLTEAGPVLSVSGAAIVIEGTRALRLAAPEIELRSTGATTISTGGDLRATVGGDCHLRSEGDQRCEARAIEVQASQGHVGVRAVAGITLDGDHIGLNDEPLPRPFAWSTLGSEAREL